jgi:hypothetical protein
MGKDVVVKRHTPDSSKPLFDCRPIDWYSIEYGGSGAQDSNEDPLEIVDVYPHGHSVEGYDFIVSNRGDKEEVIRDIVAVVGRDASLAFKLKEYALQKATEIAKMRGGKVVDMTGAEGGGLEGKAKAE